MKRSLIICFGIAFSFLLAGFALQSGNEGYTLVINGKIFNNHDVVPKQDLGNICSIEIMDMHSKQQFKPLAFQWSVNVKGVMQRGACSRTAKLEDNFPSVLNSVDDKSILIINDFKFKFNSTGFPRRFDMRIK